ncbi:HAMP domain-containing histidine kinase [Paenibacillus sp. J5C_2022]|uniref:sensor histidine kinase n=1 Tax=Paenibacillus sp. J5C2022 TaxID=2977129 RepID=UPI0021D1F060|nr:HAMP domain-containing sensor histidine kinase [Paenibacillus sp. J5C2022]MCU6710358.1 HAMP domain-containing histidine kinase [Paenibacillus sp. J5C2022]
MSIRFRLLLSFAAVVIVSVILFVSAAYLLSVAVTGDFRSISSFYRIHYSLHPLSEEEESIFLDLKYLAKHDPVLLQDPERLQSYDLELKMVQAGLVVRRNEQLVYVSPMLGESLQASELPAYEMNNYSIRNTMNLGSRFYSYAKFDFSFGTKAADRGSIYVLRERSPFAEVIRMVLPILIGIFAAVLLITSLLLYRYVTRKIIQPLERLKQSAEHIKEGDLTFTLKPESGDEIGQLVMTFEQMRLRLHESIQLQLRYEDNRKQLLSNISHDLRTPITTIKGYAEGIRDGVTNTQEKLDRYVGAIHTRATDMEKLVDELLYFSKLDLNKEPYSFQQLELVSFLKRTLDEMAIELDQQRVQLTWECPPPPEAIFVLADREKLRRVIVNLVDNSLKYMVRDPKILTIGVKRGPEQSDIWIKDNGPGIKPESLPYIFERFYREEESRDQSAPGYGLGLAIAKGIMEGHGGDISIESSVGEGTTVFLSLQNFVDHR